MSGSAPGPWLPSNTGEALVIPLRGDPHPLGVIILARAEIPYGLDDIAMGDALGTFISRVVRRPNAPRPRRSRWRPYDR
jgi:hypothetical protein